MSTKEILRRWHQEDQSFEAHHGEFTRWLMKPVLDHGNWVQDFHPHIATWTIGECRFILMVRPEWEHKYDLSVQSRIHRMPLALTFGNDVGSVLDKAEEVARELGLWVREKGFSVEPTAVLDAVG